MASVIITMKIMPSDPSSDLGRIEKEATEKITATGAKVGKVTIVPVAFGLKSIDIIFIADESKGSTDELEADVATIEEVNSVEITDVRRALG